MKKKKDRESANQISIGNDMILEEELTRLQIVSSDEEEVSETEPKVECSAIVTPFGHSLNTIEGKITKPVLHVTVGGIPARALCDTGSDYSHISGTFAKRLRTRFSASAWNRPKLYAVNNKEVTPRHQYNEMEIVHKQLNFKGKIDLGVIKEQSYDLLIGMDLMTQIGLIIITPLRTFMLKSDLEQLFQQNNRSISELSKNSWQNKDGRFLDDSNLENEAHQINHIMVQEMDSTNFDIEAQKWTFQQNEDIKTVIQDVNPIYEVDKKENESENSSTIEFKARCHTELREYFKPKEIKRISVIADNPVSNTCQVSADPVIGQNGWSVSEVIIPANVDSFILYVRNDSPCARYLNRNVSIALLEEMDESICIEIPNQNRKSKRSRKRKNKGVSETDTNQINKKMINNINEEIWSEINSYPSASLMMFNQFERELKEDDPYFTENIDQEFLKDFDVSPDLRSRDRLLMQRYLQKNRDIYAFKNDPLGRVTVWKHKIPTGGHPPIKQNPYRFSEVQKMEVEKQVSEMI